MENNNQEKIMGESIRVICRIRPLNALEKSKNSPTCVSFPGSNAISVGGKQYTFDSVLQPNVSQQQAYEVIGRPIVDSVLNGYNGTIFVYGQTSSGKTHTMEGRLKDPEHQGIIPRIIEEIFEHIEKMDGNLEFVLKVSYFELYLEKIKDLFDGMSNLNIKFLSNKGQSACERRQK
ncbi:unnamed protein product [Protopolystoma xenopodis]|uniref:Kinesin motor domain-containing protein n=1 Tax=Protopolystoma xenopodis TaxID=117903 RepID=A0A3S5ACW8_9PLAT|nr:unnamed protein product [Protopolystoma xenopodis]